MSDNERGFHHPHAVDKGIMPVEHAHPAHNDIFAAPVCGGPPMDPDPHARGFKMPVKIAPSAARPMNDMGPGLLPANGAINPNPHPYNPASQVQQRNTYAVPRWESKFK
jgi:hypothetical protein